MLDRMRDTIKRDIGDVVVSDAFKITRLSATQVLVSPGEAWFSGLPYQLRSAKDELVSGSSLAAGLLPIGVTIADDSTGRGKLINFNSGFTTPTDMYRVVITASEQLITSVQDPFLQNVNIPEDTGQKIRLLYKINLVSEAGQTQTPVPYTNETTGQNLTNQIVITPTMGGNGELLLVTSVTGSTEIDGRKLELTIRNNPGLGGGNPIPNGSSDQASFANGTLIDSYGTAYHINAIFNDVVSTQVIIRIDSEIGSPQPQLINTVPYTLIKRDVYVQDDNNGTPLGNLFFNIAKIDFNSTDGIRQQSHITDLRPRKINDQQYQVLTNEKFSIEVVGDINISSNSTGSVLTWDAAFSLVNPFTPSQSIPASSAALVDGGFLLYTLNMVSGGTVARGNLSLTATSFGATVSFSGSPSLAQVRIGNVLRTSAETVVITAIDDVNKNVSVSPSTTMSGAVTVYLDSFGPLTAIQDENAFVLATRNGSNLWVLETKLTPNHSTVFGQASGGGSGSGINYLLNPADSSSFDSNTGNWVAYKDAAGVTPVDGTGGSPTVTITQSSTSPLRGTGSGLITKDAANRQGEGVSVNFTIDKADKAKLLSVQFDYIVSSGTFNAGSPSQDSDIEIWVYDVTNAALIPVTPYKLVSNSSVTPEAFKGTFQTSATSTSYRLILHIPTTNASAWVLQVDNFSVGPQAILNAPSMGDWLPYTPVFQGFGTVTNIETWYRIVGDSVEIQGKFETGTPTATEARLGLPPGMTSDSVKISSTRIVGGWAVGTAPGGTSFSDFTLAQPGVTYINFGLQDATNAGLTIQNGNAIVNPNVFMSITALLPIAGKSSNTLTGNDADARVVAARYTGDGGTYTVSPTQPIQYNTKVYDTHAAVTTGSSWRFTAPVSGYYEVHATGQNESGNPILTVFVNGIYIQDLTNLDVAVRTASVTVFLTAGDYVDTRISTTIVSVTFNASQNTISIEKVSGPALPLATETAAASYEIIASQTISSGGNDIIWDTQNYDTHSGMNTNTGVYTIPVSGVYAIISSLQTTATSFTAAQSIDTTIVINGTLKRQFRQFAWASVNLSLQSEIYADFRFQAGDTIKITGLWSGGTSTTLLAHGAGGASTNYFNIKRIGL